MVRNQILKDPKPFSQWSRTIEEVADGIVDLPDLLTADFVHFLRYNGKTSKHADQIVDSIGQDILSNYTFSLHFLF